MRLSEAALRLLISEVILEDAGMHRCMDGSVVPFDSSDCLTDVGNRIDDATYHRDECSLGTDQRMHLNGLLKDLRKKRRHVSKVIPLEAELKQAE